MSFLGKLFEVMSYYTGVETPMANDSVIMDTWDELEEEEQRKYLKSLLYGAVIAVTLATGHYIIDALYGEKLEKFVDRNLEFIKEKGISYGKNKTINELEQDLIREDISNDNDNEDYLHSLYPGLLDDEYDPTIPLTSEQLDELPDGALIQFKTFTEDERIAMYNNRNVMKVRRKDLKTFPVAMIQQLLDERRLLIVP